MKHTALLIAGLILSIFTHAQTADGQDHIKIIAANDSITIKIQNRSLKLSKIQDIDSCLKNNLPDLTLPVADLETRGDLTSQNHRAIITILDKYRCPVASEKTISDGKAKGVVSEIKFKD